MRKIVTTMDFNNVNFNYEKIKKENKKVNLQRNNFKCVIMLYSAVSSWN